MTTKRVATRAEVAALANVSPALVSYVINGGPRPVSAPARARILAAIDELDYRPDTIASALTGGSSRSVGVVIPTTVNPFLSELVMEIETRLFERGYVAVVGITNDEPKVERAYIDSFLDRRADAIIVISSNPELLFKTATDASIPIILANGVEAEHAVRTISVDHAKGAATVVEHLHSWGHRVIACIAGPRHDPISNQRIAGWRAKQLEGGYPADATLVFHTETSMDGGVRAARLALASSRLGASDLRPTALFVTSDVLAIGALFACREAGILVPEQMSIVAMDGTQAARFSNPVLTTLRLPISELAEALIVRAISNERVLTKLEGNLVIGDSSGPAPTL